MPFPEYDGPGQSFPQLFYSVALDLANAPYEYAGTVGDEAVELLLSQFRHPKIEAMVRALVGPMQRFEDVLWHILTRVVDMTYAQGVHLDLFGKILKLPRLGLTDTEYRSRLGVWQLVLRSTGKPEELIRIADLFDGVSAAGDTVIYDEGSGTGGIVIEMDHLMTYSPTALALFLRKATAGGVEMQLVWSPGGTTASLETSAGATYGEDEESEDEGLAFDDEEGDLGGTLADVRS
jgi:hypothetical protein